MHRPYALILDDHPLVARGVADFLRTRLPHLEVVTAADASGLWQAVQTQGAPAIALVDFWLADGAALDLLAQLRQRCPHTPLAVLTGDDSPDLLARVQAVGAQGFVCKQASPDTFAQAVEALLAGLTWFHTAPPAAAPPHRRELPVTPAELGLSARQGEILALVLQGLPNKRIALQFDLSESTVKEHMSAILQRLGARTRVEAITRLRGQRLVLPAGPPPRPRQE